MHWVLPPMAPPWGCTLGVPPMAPHLGCMLGVPPMAPLWECTLGALPATPPWGCTLGTTTCDPPLGVHIGCTTCSPPWGWHNPLPPTSYLLLAHAHLTVTPPLPARFPISPPFFHSSSSSLYNLFFLSSLPFSSLSSFHFFK